MTFPIFCFLNEIHNVFSIPLASLQPLRMLRGANYSIETLGAVSLILGVQFTYVFVFQSHFLVLTGMTLWAFCWWLKTLLEILLAHFPRLLQMPGQHARYDAHLFDAILSINLYKEWQRHVWSVKHRSTTMSHIFSETSTGCRFQKEYNFDVVRNTSVLWRNNCK